MWWMLLAKKAKENGQKAAAALDRPRQAALQAGANSRNKLAQQQTEAMSYEAEPDHDADDFSDEKRRKAREKLRY